jgi:hypothetical protein
MKTSSTFSVAVGSVFFLAVLLLGSAHAEARISPGAMEVMTASASTSPKSADALTKAKARADLEIDRRVTSLTAAAATIANLKKVSAVVKASIQSTLSGEITTLASFKTKVDGDTDAATLKVDAQSITKDYRIYALILPQAHIAASSDQVLTIADAMTALSVKLQTRVSALQTAGTNVSALQASLADAQTKVADAKTQAAAALTETSVLVPDQGSATVMASNKAALKDAQQKLKTAQTDLKAARADIESVLKAVKGTGKGGGMATSTASTTAH